MDDFHAQNEIIFTWSIKNFSMCWHGKGDNICSPSFFTKNFKKANWRLFLFPKGSAESVDNHIAVNLGISWPDYAPDTLSFGFELCVLDTNGLRKLSVSNDNCQFWRDSLLRFFNFANRDRLFKERDLFLPNDTLTIQCHVWARCSIQSLTNRYFSRTTIDIDKCVFRWDVKDFEKWKPNDGIAVPVPIPSRFEIKTVLIKNSNQDEQIQLFFRQNESEKYSRFMVCAISFIDHKGIQCMLKTATHIFLPNLETKHCIFHDFASKSKIMKDKANFLKDGALNLQCDTSISSGKLVHSPIIFCEPTRKMAANVATVETLKDDLKRMYHEKKFTDVVLKAEGELFSAHKALLSVRSPVFRAMFEQDMSENISGCVDIPDLDAKTLESLLIFMYSGNLEEWDCDSVSKLLIAADKYQMLELREKCTVVLKSTLSAETVCQVLVLADFQEDKDLKSAALDFICDNSREVLQSPEWFNFIENNRNLSIEVLYQLSVDLNRF